MVPGVVSAELNYASSMLLVEYDPLQSPQAAIAAVVRRSGHGIEPVSAVGTAAEATPTWWEANRTTVAVVGSGLLVAIGWVARLFASGSIAGAVSTTAFVLAVLAGWTVLVPRAVASARARSVDMNVLMVIAVAGALGIGEYSEAAAVVFLFALGGWLEARAVARTRGSIRELMRLAPQRARVRRNDAPVDVVPEDVGLGERLIVRPGERIALDGIVAAGASAVDEAPITGEPLPAEKRLGDRVYAGSLNTTGLLEVNVTATVADSTLARVVRLVEEAQAAKAPVQQTVDRFSRVYTPTVVALAVVVALVPPLAGLGSWVEWLHRALVVLVTACPCALVISTPVTLVSAISRAGKDGVLVKGGAYLEVAARTKAVAFDKTGTLTHGRPSVVAVHGSERVEPDRVLALSASLESHSLHPAGRAVVAAAKARGAALLPVEGFSDVPGRGVSGRIEGVESLVVSPAFAEEVASIPRQVTEAIRAAESDGLTVLVFVSDGVAAGWVGVKDPLRDEAARVVGSLIGTGIEHTVLLTGDNERAAAAVAAGAGLSAHMARLLPQDKVEAVVRLKSRFGTVAMVGDGVNDAPALAAADIGIAMGAAGSDTALETADVALMADDLLALPGFFRLGRRTLATVRQNVAFSVLVKVVVLVAAVIGYANMWLAVFADTGVALIVIANGMRLLRRTESRL